MESTDRFARQLDLLARRFPVLAETIRAADATSITLQPARSGDLTAFVHHDGRPAALHSTYDPYREAEQLASTSVRVPSQPVVLFGIGLGYVAEAIHERLAAGTPLFLCEPDAGILKSALSHRDLSRLISSSHVIWLPAGSVAAMAQGLQEWSELLADGCQVIATPAFRKRYPQWTEALAQRVNDICHFSALARTTRRARGKQALENLIANLPHYVASEPMPDLPHAGSRVPALVIAAGPSLARNRHLLREVQGRMLTLVVGTAYKQVCSAGLEPDLVVQIDYSDLCRRHFQGVASTGKTLLLADATASPETLATWPGRMSLLSHRFADHLVGRSTPNRIATPQGLTVAHTAFYVAQYFQCDPVIFVGLDLAFPDALYYAQGNGLHEVWRSELNRFHTLEMKEWERLARRRQGLVETVDWDGNAILTDRQMEAYRLQFESDFAQAPQRIIDATEGGSRKQGAIPMTLRQAIDRYAKAPLPTDWLAPLASPGVPSPREIESALRRARERLLELEATLQSIHKAQRRILARPDASAADRQRLDTLQRRIAQRWQVEFEMASTYDAGAELERQAARRMLATSALDAIRRERLQIEQDAAYVARLAVAALALGERLASAAAIWKVPTS